MWKQLSRFWSYQRPLDDDKGYWQRYFNFVTMKSELFNYVIDFIYIANAIV